MKIKKFIQITIFIMAMVFFFVGFHNIDNAYNMALLSEWEYDQILIGERLDSRNLYSLGTKYIFISLVSFIGSFFLSLISEKEND